VDTVAEPREKGCRRLIAPGHDAWTVGDEACVAFDTTGVARYAKRD
jgi:hypothetical protein